MGVLKFLGVSGTRQPDYGNKDAYIVPAATIADQAFKNRSCFSRSTVVQLQALSPGCCWRQLPLRVRIC